MSYPTYRGSRYRAYVLRGARHSNFVDCQHSTIKPTHCPPRVNWPPATSTYVYEYSLTTCKWKRLQKHCRLQLLHTSMDIGKQEEIGCSFKSLQSSQRAWCSEVYRLLPLRTT